MTILLLKGYNNYFNRIRKQETSITNYKTASTSYLEYGEVNFNPNDGITTELIVGGDLQKMASDKPLDFETAGSPDYLIAYNTVQSDPVIHSRWFILECVRIMNGQYRLALKRDVLIDYGEDIMSAPCFVEKGTITDINNKLIYNSEGFVGNQQKQGEVLLRDRTNCAWLVGYIKKDMDQSQSVSYTFPSDTTGSVDLSGIINPACVTFKNLDGTVSSSTKTAANYNANKSYCKFRVNYKDTKGWDYNLKENFTLAGNLISVYSAGINSDWEGLDSVAAYMDHHGSGNNRLGYAIMERIGKELFDHTFQWGYVKHYFNLLVDNTKYSITTGNNLDVVADDLMQYNGKLVTYNNKVYRLSVGQGTEKAYDTYYTGEDNVSNDYISMLYYEVDTGGNYPGTWTVQRNQDNPTKKKVKITLNYRQYNIVATEEIVGETITYTLPVPAYRNTCDDALYDMFCIPLSPIDIGLKTAPETNTVILGEDANHDPEYIFLDITGRYGLAMAATLATKLGAGTQAGYIYDLQLLPYCPFEFGVDDIYFENHIYGPTYGKYVIDIKSRSSKDYTFINKHATVDGQDVDIPVGIVFYPKKANFSTTFVTEEDEEVVSIGYSEGNYTIHDEWLEIKDPILIAQGRKDGLTLWTLHEEFPYPITEGPWGIGPNSNNTNVDVEINAVINDEEFTNEDCVYLNLYSSASITAIPEGYKPFLSITSDALPLKEASDYTSTYVLDGTIKVKAHWIKPDDALDKKIKNECDFYRLTSPNYNSFYEFKKTKLYDGINGLRAVCTYKPYNPYIKLNPNLNDSLYSDKWYNDNIGLVLAGDYSLPMMSDAMVNYELNNRNYQAIFNRQIQNLDVSQRIALEQQDWTGKWGIATGGVGGAAAGAMAGAKAGPWGAAIGGVVGGAGGLAAGIAGYNVDREWLKEQQYEARDYAIDQFNYQLGNVKALPQTMTKSTPFSFNNKVWPILEYFSCTDEEKTVLRNKLKYDGMTIMAVGQLQQYATAGGRLKGKIIRLPNIVDDSHISQAIYEEVDKGFYEGEE